MLPRDGSKQSHSHANNISASLRPVAPLRPRTSTEELYNFLSRTFVRISHGRQTLTHRRPGDCQQHTPLFRSHTLYLHFKAPEEENTKVNLAFQRFRVHFHNPLVLYTKQYNKWSDPNFFVCVDLFVLTDSLNVSSGAALSNPLCMGELNRKHRAAAIGLTPLGILSNSRSCLAQSRSAIG